jgi:hypothetical protein
VPCSESNWKSRYASETSNRFRSPVFGRERQPPCWRRWEGATFGRILISRS